MYHGDAAELPADCADLVVSDPPYMLTSGGNNANWNVAGEGYKNDGEIVQCDITPAEIMEICDHVLKAGDCYIMANNREIFNFEFASRKHFKFHNQLIWHKETATPNRWFMKNCEFILYLFKGKARTINNPGATQLIRCPNPRNKVHPTEKPVSLMRYLIEQSSDHGDVVCDPFAGSGSTGVAAIESGRFFIGAEIDKNHFETAVARLKAAKYNPGFPDLVFSQGGFFD